MNFVDFVREAIVVLLPSQILMLNVFWWQEIMQDMVAVRFNTTKEIVIGRLTYLSKT